MMMIGHRYGYVLAAAITGRQVIVVLIAAVIFLALLMAPIAGENLFGAFSAGASKVAPTVFFLGLGFLVAGLVLRIGLLDIAGGGLIGAVVLGAIVINY